MKETKWRDKLVRELKMYAPALFVWPMDSHFKAGFPDLYIVSKGIPYHYELKVTDKTPGFSVWTLLEEIQKVTCERLRAADAEVRVLALHKKTGHVTVYTLNRYAQDIYTADEFKSYWRSL